MAAEADLPAGGAREAGSAVAAAVPRLRFQIAQLRVDQADVAIIGPATLGAGIVAADGDAPGSLVLVETAQIMRGVVYVRRGVQHALGLVAEAGLVPPGVKLHAAERHEIGRASCRERVCKYV